MRFALSLAMVLAGAALLGAPAQAAQCLNVTIFDEKGAVAHVGAAFMLDGSPIMGLSVPAQYTRKIGDPTPCPQDLVNKVQELFNGSCLTEDRRKKAAEQAKSPLDLINKRCSEMAQALRDNPKP